MTDALTTAFANAERMKMAAAASLSSPALAGNIGAGGLIQPSSLSKSAEQLTHFRSWVYVCINAIAQRVAGQSLYVGRVRKRPDGRKSVLQLPGCFKALGDSVEALESHPLLDAIQDPNPLMLQSTLVYSLVASLKLTGAGYLWLTEEDGKLQLWPIPPSWLEPVDVFRSGWLLRTPGNATPIELAGDDVLAIYLPNPANPFTAQSPLQAVAAAVAIDEQILSAQFRSFKFGIAPQLAVRVGRLPNMPSMGADGQRPVLEPEQRLEICEAVRKQFQGAANWNYPLIVDGMIEGFDKLSLSPKEMAFLDSGESAKKRIFQGFGVNPIIVGEIQDSNRAQATVADELFCANAVNPLVELLSQSLTAWVGERFASSGERLIVWLEPARAHDPEQSLKEWETGLKYGAVDLNEYRVNVLGMPSDNRFDVILSPAAMLERTARPASKALNRLEVSRNGSVVH